MSIILLVLVNVLAIVALSGAIYMVGRIQIPIWADKDFLFSSPKLGRIKARRRSGRIVGFLDNLVGKGQHVNELTGKIEPDEVRPTGFWWRRFGVRFIGLDDVYTYKIAKEATEGMDGKFTYTEEPASSIYYEGTYPLTILLYTMEGILLRVKLQLKTITVDAAKALSLPVSWTIPLFAAVIAASRDHFGRMSTSDLISAQNESGAIKIAGRKIANSGFVKLIRGLNDAKKGNISLADVCGQKIEAVNVVDIDFATDQDRETFLKPYKATQEAQETANKADGEAKALIIRSTAEKDAAINQAAAIKARAEGEAAGHTAKVAAFKGNEVVAGNVIASEQLRQMTNLTVLGVSPSVLVDSKKGGNP